MPYTFENAFDNELVTLVVADEESGMFEVQIGDLDTHVTIELGRFMTSDKTKFWVSHAIKTPSQATPYRTSIPFYDSPAEALHRAIDGLTSFYREAVDEGHEPKEEWLVEI